MIPSRGFCISAEVFAWMRTMSGWRNGGDKLCKLRRFSSLFSSSMFVDLRQNLTPVMLWRGWLIWPGILNSGKRLWMLGRSWLTTQDLNRWSWTLKSLRNSWIGGPDSSEPGDHQQRKKSTFSVSKSWITSEILSILFIKCSHHYLFYFRTKLWSDLCSDNHNKWIIIMWSKSCEIESGASFIQF